MGLRGPKCGSSQLLGYFIEKAQAILLFLGYQLQLEDPLRHNLHNTMGEETYDVFISHASEDKESVAKVLAESLRRLGVKVWYDEFSLSVGDSLRQSIDKGIAASTYGIVILSPSFFEKNWPTQELNGLFAKELCSGKTILPVWHDVDQAYVCKFSPMVADRLAVSTSKGIETVVKDLLSVIRPHLYLAQKDDVKISLTPTSFVINPSAWSAVTPIYLSNYGDIPVFSLSINLIVPSGAVKSKDIEVKVQGLSSGIVLEQPGMSISGDHIMLDCEDLAGNSFVQVILACLMPGQARTLQVQIKAIAKESLEINASIADFEMEYRPLFHVQNGQISYGFKATENCKLLGMRVSNVPPAPQMWRVL